MKLDREAILSGAGDAADMLVAADACLLAGDRELAASALDRAHALAPDDEGIARQRRAILDELALDVRGLVFRYVPAGTFLMGSDHGDPDERPVHARRLDAFWITDVPVTWSAFNALAGFAPPPEESPAGDALDRDRGFHFHERTKIRVQYCADGDDPAEDSYMREETAYGTKPMVAVAPADVAELARALDDADACFGLPSEAEWEKAARGGLEGALYAWGSASPTRALADFGQTADYRLNDPRRYAPNGYGLHGMCGSIAEWTADRYDALAYHRAAAGDLAPAEAGSETHPYVIRGGSFLDCARSVTVSFRATHFDPGWRAEERLRFATPTIGFRLVRRRR